MSGSEVGCWFTVVEYRFMVLKLVVGFWLWNIDVWF